MADYIEGRRAVEEAVRAGVRVRRVLVQAQGDRARHDEADQLEALVARVRAANPQAPVERVPREELDRLSARGASHGAHQGIMVEVPPFAYTPIEEVARAGAARDDALVVVLDHVTDEGNLGAVIRSAEVVGATAVVIPSKRAAQVTVGVYKTSAGAALYLPVAQVPNVARALDTLKQAGFWVAGASEHAQGAVWDAPLSGRIALVMGSEGQGISRLVLKSCDFLVKLPQAGHVGSLNVAQATCALCYEWLRQCRVRAGGAS